MASLDISSPILFVFDCDSTIIEEEVIDLLAREAGSYEEVKRITEEAMRGNLEFSRSLKRRVETLKGLPEEALARVAAGLTVTTGARELIETIHERGSKAAIVSGGFMEVLDPLAEDLGVDAWKANRLEIIDGALTGKTVGETVDGATKAKMLAEWANDFGIDPGNTVAVGDGANDIPMMKIAGASFAFNAKPVVREVADYSISDNLLRVAEILFGS